jgi:hypothetical protein
LTDRARLPGPVAGAHCLHPARKRIHGPEGLRARRGRCAHSPLSSARDAAIVVVTAGPLKRGGAGSGVARGSRRAGAGSARAARAARAAATRCPARRHTSAAKGASPRRAGIGATVDAGAARAWGQGRPTAATAGAATAGGPAPTTASACHRSTGALDGAARALARALAATTAADEPGACQRAGHYNEDRRRIVDSFHHGSPFAERLASNVCAVAVDGGQEDFPRKCRHLVADRPQNSTSPRGTTAGRSRQPAAVVGLDGGFCCDSSAKCPRVMASS